MTHKPDSAEAVIRIFVSYARKDKRWLDDDYRYHLIPWLIESMRKQNVVFWYDKELVASEVFTRRIQEEIDHADIAILIVSQPFLNSDFIEKFELPRIKDRADQKKLAVVPVLVEQCSWEEDDFLSARQMLPGKPTPLINYTEREADWAQVKFDLLDGIKKLVKKIRVERAQAGEVQRNDREQAEVAQFVEKQKQQENARRATEAEAARAKAAAEKTKAEAEAKAAQDAAERKQQQQAARAKASAEKAKAEEAAKIARPEEERKQQAAASTKGDLCRVDDLLQQFLERYGRNSLSPGNSQIGNLSWDGAAVGQRREADLGGGVKLELCGIPVGKFTMGSPESDETPHEVTLTKAFWLGRMQVTQAQWEAVMGNNPSQSKGAELPVENVSWDDALDYCQKLNAKALLPADWKFALPTEAQWEYACRAETTGDYAGNLAIMAWYSVNSVSKTHPVATKKPNAWGHHNMHGNVWEWCADWYDDYPTCAVTDPTGPNTGSVRVNRGGSWGSGDSHCRSAHRGWSAPDLRNGGIGFRVAAVPAGV